MIVFVPRQVTRREDCFISFLQINCSGGVENLLVQGIAEAQILIGDKPAVLYEVKFSLSTISKQLHIYKSVNNDRRK